MVSRRVRRHARVRAAARAGRHDDRRAAVRRLGRRATRAQDLAAGDGGAQRTRARTGAVLSRAGRLTAGAPPAFSLPQKQTGRI
ncbi:hypothetical protein F01_130001 [Burkholderia cenocepacia]|nr:hypothetical protein F01_130001 [Burkholderia cenocepacia]